MFKDDIECKSVSGVDFLLIHGNNSYNNDLDSLVDNFQTAYKQKGACQEVFDLGLKILDYNYYNEFRIGSHVRAYHDKPLCFRLDVDVLKTTYFFYVGEALNYEDLVDDDLIHIFHYFRGSSIFYVIWDLETDIRYIHIDGVEFIAVDMILDKVIDLYNSTGKLPSISDDIRYSDKRVYLYDLEGNKPVVRYE